MEENPGRTWLVDLIGVDYFGHVVSFQILSRGNEADWQQAVDRLGNLGQIRRIILCGTSVNDDVLAQLNGMNCLELLMLRIRASVTPD